MAGARAAFVLVPHPRPRGERQEQGGDPRGQRSRAAPAPPSTAPVPPEAESCSGALPADRVGSTFRSLFLAVPRGAGPTNVV